MEYVLSVIVLMGIYIILSTSFNLIIGYGGLISIAHPIFFAIGAYTTGLCSLHFNTFPLVSLLLSGAAAIVFSLMLSLSSRSGGESASLIACRPGFSLLIPNPELNSSSQT